jgi:hypothetical protein
VEADPRWLWMNPVTNHAMCDWCRFLATWKASRLTCCIAWGDHLSRHCR